MASPQKENGYSPIANEILEHIAKLPLNGTQWRIIVVVWRYTYGFSRKEHELSESFIASATGIHKKQIQRELNELISFNIIFVTKEATFSSSRQLQFNKDYDSWEVTKKLPGSKKDTHTGNQKATSPGNQKATQDKQKTNIKTTKEDSSNRKVINYFREAYSKKFDVAYLPNWKIDGKIIKDFLEAKYSVDYLMKYIDWFLNSKDRYLEQHGFKIPLLKTKLTEYHASQKKAVNDDIYRDMTDYKL